MKIKRTLYGAEVMFELTKTELSEAYNEYQNILDMEVVKQDINERIATCELTKRRKREFLSILTSENALSEIAREYRFGIDNYGWNEKYALFDAISNYIDKMEESENADD